MEALVEAMVSEVVETRKVVTSKCGMDIPYGQMFQR